MMSKLTLSLVGTAAIAAGMTALPTPALAQQDAIAEVIVYGTDPCPRSSNNEVVVCARKQFYANGGCYSSGAVPASFASLRSRFAWLMTCVRQPV